MQQSETIKELAAALAKAQAQMKPALKESVNPHFKSKYADLGAVWEACRKPLTDNGLSVVQLPTDADAGRVALTTMLIHSSGEYLNSTFSTKLMQDSAQGIGSALTYLRRYGLAAIVGIVADEDDDGNAASASAPPPAEQRAYTNGNGTSGKASEKQIKMLFAIWNKGGYDGTLQEWIATTYGCGVEDLSIKQASNAIETLQGQG